MTNYGFARRVAGVVVAGTLLLCAIVAPGPAGADDLASMRARAQAIADQVSLLEHRLAGLEHHQKELGRRILRASALIGRYELQRHEATAAVQRARRAYIRAAVRQYESPDQSALMMMMLSAKTIGQMYTLDAAASRSGTITEQRLSQLQAAQRSLSSTITRIDRRKQALMRAKEQADALAQKVTVTLGDRKQRLSEMVRAVKRLEAKARAEARAEAAAAAAREAATQQSSSSELHKVLAPAGPTPGIPHGFVPTGVTFEGVASWYGPGFAGQPTASGQIFDPSEYTAASKDLPLGTWLYVTHGGKGVVVLVNDRGPYVDGRVLDLSEAAAEAIGISGVGWIQAQVVVKT